MFISSLLKSLEDERVSLFLYSYKFHLFTRIIGKARGEINLFFRSFRGKRDRQCNKKNVWWQKRCQNRMSGKSVLHNYLTLIFIYLLGQEPERKILQWWIVHVNWIKHVVVVWAFKYGWYSWRIKSYFLCLNQLHAFTFYLGASWQVIHCTSNWLNNESGNLSQAIWYNKRHPFIKYICK